MKQNRQLILSMLAVGMALGTAWAIRGRFGHEQGAAWAGAIGALSLLLVAKRGDWYAKAFKITMAAAFGWGISGAMSYGVIVGYGRGTDFVNVYYGLLMLFVLGILYGFIGGGLFGLALLDSRENKIKWHAVITEMIALGVLFYAVLIDQLGWLMTPPRSEAWAACFGAAVALAWYINRNNHYAVMKVAVWSAIGAGFGFAFGNFLQVMGSVSGVKFNFWNVMEYSIGFFGGIGMAYGTFTSPWVVTEEKREPGSALIPILFVALFIPFVVWDQSFVTDRLKFITEEGGADSTIFYVKLIAIAAILLLTALTLRRNYTIREDPEHYRSVRIFFILYTGLYIFLSFLITGVFVHPVEQYLYVLNFLVILYLIPGINGSIPVHEYQPRRWIVAAMISIALIAVLAVVAINSHGELHGSQIRFEKKL